MILKALIIAVMLTSCTSHLQPTSTFEPVTKRTVEARINDYIKEHPDVLNVKVEPSDSVETCMVLGDDPLARILSDGSISTISEFLYTDIHQLRLAAHSAISSKLRNARQTGDDSDIQTLRKIYDDGSLRIKFELFDYFEPRDEFNDKYEILNLIIKDKNLPVFYNDFMRFYERYQFTKDESPIDIIGAIRKLAKSKNDYERKAATILFSNLDTSYDEAIPLAIELLNNDKIDKPSRLRIINKLGEFGERASDAIPVLEEYAEKDISSPDNMKIWLATVATLYLLGERQEEMFKILHDNIRFEDNLHIVYYSLSNIRRLGRDAKPMIPDIIELNRSGKLDRFTPTGGWYIYGDIIYNTLRDIAESEDAFVDILIDIDKQQDDSAPANTLRYLSQSANTNEKARDLLISKIHDENTGVAVRSINSLLYKNYIDNSELIEALREVLRRDDVFEHGSLIMNMLRKLQDDARPAANEIVRLIASADEYSSISQQAMEMALQFGVSKDQIIAKLSEMLDSENSNVRMNAVYHLGKMSGDAEHLLDKLIAIPPPPRFSINRIPDTANMIIQGINADSDVSVSTLLDAMRFDHNSNFSNAWTAIQAKGGTEEQFIERLGELIVGDKYCDIHPDANIRSAAMRKLTEFESIKPAVPYFFQFITDPLFPSKPDRVVGELLGKILGDPNINTGKYALKLERIYIDTHPSIKRVLEKHAYNVPLDLSAAVDLHIEKLKSNDPDTIYEVIRELRFLKEQAHKTLPFLIELYETGYIKSVQLEKVTQEPTLKDAPPQLTDYLDSDDKSEHTQEKPHETTYQKSIIKNDHRILSVIKEILSEIKPETDIELGDILKIADTNIDWLCLAALDAYAKKIGDPDKAIQELFKLIHHENTLVGARAADTIASFGIHAIPYVPRMREELPDGFPRIDAPGYYLGGDVITRKVYQNLKSDDPISVDELLSLMESPSEAEVSTIISQLKRRTDDHTILNRIMELAGHEDSRVQSANLRNLQRVRDISFKVVPDLLELSKKAINKDDSRRAQSVNNALTSILRQVEIDTDISVEVLVNCMDQGRIAIMTNAAEAIKTKTGSYDLAIKKLRELEHHEDPVIRRNASRVLEEIGNQE